MVNGHGEGFNQEKNLNRISEVLELLSPHLLITSSTVSNESEPRGEYGHWLDIDVLNNGISFVLVYWSVACHVCESKGS